MALDSPQGQALVRDDIVPLSNDTNERTGRESSSPLHNIKKKNNNKILLILVDGTWSQAKRMLRHSSRQIIERCQRVQLGASSANNATSIY